MPLDIIPPPRAAERALDESLQLLAETDSRLQGLVPVPGAHSVTYCPLEFIAGLAKEDANDWIERLDRSCVWRFFVRNETVRFAVIEVGAVPGQSDRFSFLAFREGLPVHRAMEAFVKAVVWGEGRKSAYGLHLLRVPGLSADFYWLRRLNVLTGPLVEEETIPHWFLSIPASLPGFNPGETYPARVTFDLIRDESIRALESSFAKKLHGSCERDGHSCGRRSNII